MRVRSESVILSRTELGSISLRTPSALMSKQRKHPEEGPGRHREPVTREPAGGIITPLVSH